MALLNILHHPDERLHQIAQPVKALDRQIKQYILDMIETMYAAGGIGLAATQVNIQQRIFVMDTSEEKNQIMVFVNPEITNRDGQITYEEGCLSIPGILGRVNRSENIATKAINQQGNTFSFQATGLSAICIQHEIDHLNGKLFIEYLSLLKQQRIRQKLKKLHENNM